MDGELSGAREQVGGIELNDFRAPIPTRCSPVARFEGSSERARCAMLPRVGRRRPSVLQTDDLVNSQVCG